MDEKLELLKKNYEEHLKEGKIWDTKSKNNHVSEWTAIISESAWCILEDKKLTHEEKKEMVLHFEASMKALNDTLNMIEFSNFLKEMLNKKDDEENSQGEA